MTYYKDDAVLNMLEKSPDVKISGLTTKTDQSIQKTWNSYGNIISEISERESIDPRIALAVFMSESRGDAFSDVNGKQLPIIRFENHIFIGRLSSEKRIQAKDLFIFNANEKFKGHMFRESKNLGFKSFHGSQALEYKALLTASNIDASVAFESISMGIPQVMGFNHSVIGYDSAEKMYDNFCLDDKFHIFAFFDFISHANSQLVPALKNKDFRTFAKYYNGAGQVETYSNIMSTNYNRTIALIKL